MARVLIVEPDVEVRSLFALLIERLGWEPVLPSENGHDVDVDADVDAILLEPGVRRGVELCASIREQSPDVPIVCASIYPETSEVRALRPSAFLVKPFPLSRLERALEAAVASA